MYVWHDESFPKRIEFYLKPLDYINIIVGTAFILKLPSEIKPELASPYDLVVYSETSEKAPVYCLDPDNLIYVINSSIISPAVVYRFFVYYGAVGGIEKASHLVVRYYDRDSSQSHPTNHTQLVNIYETDYSFGPSYTYTDLYIDPSNHDYFSIHVSAWFYVDDVDVGTWWFAVDSDDSGEVSIDDTVVASWYGAHGVCNCYDHNGSISLTKGWHKLVSLHEDGGGGDALFVYFKSPSDGTWKKFSTNSLYIADVDYGDNLVHSYKFIEYGYYDMFLQKAVQIFPSLDIINLLDKADLTSLVGDNFTNSGAAVEQPICSSFTGITTTKTPTSYVYCDTSTVSDFSVFLGVLFTEGGGNCVLLYLGSNIIVFADTDSSLSVKLNTETHVVGYRLPSGCCSLAITYDGSLFCLFINGNVVYRTEISGLQSSYLSIGGASGYNSVSSDFFYCFKFGYVEPYFIDYLHSTLLKTILYVSGYDTENNQCTLIVDPNFVVVNEPNLYRLLTTSGCGSCNITLDGSVLCTDTCDDGVDYSIGSSGYSTANYSCGAISKTLEIKVNTLVGLDYDVNAEFNVVDTAAGLKDFFTDSKFRTPTLSGVDDILTEYQFDDKHQHIMDVLIEFYLYTNDYPTVMDVPVEFYFDIDLDSYFYDIMVYFVMSSFYAMYFTDIQVWYSVHETANTYEDINTYFEIAASKYYDYMSDIYVSSQLYDDTALSVATQSGTLQRYHSDVIVSDHIYDDVFSDVIVSLEDYLDYDVDTATASGLLQRYDSDVIVSSEIHNDNKFEVKLNSIEFHNFSIDITETVITDNTYSVDIIDKFYGIDSSSIAITMNGNDITDVSYSSITHGYHVVFSCDIFTYPTSLIYEFRVYVKNNYGDEGIASYYVKRGYRFTYNKHHLIIHDYNQLISILMLVENNVDVFPAVSSENLAVFTEVYPYRSLSASITPVGGATNALKGSITVKSPNFYPGGTYTVVITCRDFAGNEMPPFEFTFTISDEQI